MRHLFAFIIKNYFFFLFLLLEVIALSMVIGNNYQRTIIMNSSNRFTGGINNTYHSLSEFFSLKKANQELALENEKFRNSDTSSFLVRDTSVYFSLDSLFRYISAEVISASISKQKNYLMINKGSQHGIEVDMGVVSPKGIVGTVIEVSENYSVVMPAINIRNKINGRIKKNNHTGNIEWDGKNYREGLLTDIPTHVRLVNGDSIITSGYSHIFPAGINVGIVKEYYTNVGDKFNSARILFAVDFNNLNYVYVIKNLMLEEQLLLEKEVGDE
jgi:rod shape-determining protein MreC